MKDADTCSYFISGCVHKASTSVNGHRVYGDGILVLFDSLKWSKEKAQLAEKAKNVARYMQVSSSNLYSLNFIHLSQALWEESVWYS